MYRQIIIPDSSSYLLELPASFIGREIEIIAFEIDKATTEEIHNKYNRQELEKYFYKCRFDVKNLKLSRDEANER